MSPVAISIANDLSLFLWDRLRAGERPSEMELARWRRDAKPLESADPHVFLLITAQLAALTGDTNKVAALARTAEGMLQSPELWHNWHLLLAVLGLMREAYALAKAGWTQYPADITILEAIIKLAYAFEDASSLEAALETWQKLQPEKIHPYLAVHALDAVLEANPDDDATALAIFETVAASDTFAPVTVPACLQAALDKVEE